jgi:hypothetical protein
MHNLQNPLESTGITLLIGYKSNIFSVKSLLFSSHCFLNFNKGADSLQISIYYYLPVSRAALITGLVFCILVTFEFWLLSPKRWLNFTGMQFVMPQMANSFTLLFLVVLN